MKPRLIIISDLWGVEKSEYHESNLHYQFINGGIEFAVKRLLELEKKELMFWHLVLEVQLLGKLN